MINDLIEMILSNTLYIIITAGILIALVYFAFKKIKTLFIIALIALVGFLSYIYYTGESVQDAVDKAKEVVR